MKFIIERTSIWDDDFKPLHNTYLSTVNFYHVRTLQSFESFDERFSHREGKFLEKGFDHKINDEGFIQRTEQKQRWCIDIDEIEQLVELVESNKIIIEKRDYDTPIIEIYDDYRE
ncbi:hypothetical protein [Mammaliicoccus lentus]|uniref:hypothetical protein n=1 Tax=Mammaliicoccus lentus TaxID=42858 RepID=UPI00374EEDBF